MGDPQTERELRLSEKHKHGVEGKGVASWAGFSYHHHNEKGNSSTGQGGQSCPAFIQVPTSQPQNHSVNCFSLQNLSLPQDRENWPLFLQIKSSNWYKM